MKIEIKVPAMGESISEATIGPILKPSGSKVSRDDELIELETDKVNQVLYAPQEGVFQLSVSKDDVVKIGQVIGYIDTEAVETKETEIKEAKAQLAKKAKVVAEAPLKEEAKEITLPDKEEVVSTTEKVSSRFGKEELLKELKEGGKEEVREEGKEARKISTPSSLSPASSAKAERGKRETRQKMSKIRKIIANRLVEVQQTTAMLTTFNEIDLSQVIALREKYKESFQKQHGVKLGFMSFFVKASVSALRAIPEINSFIADDEIVHREYYDLGIAVSTERGLVVPVIRDCDRMSFAQIESAIESFAKKAKEGGLSVDDLQGGGFTITNGGIYGSLLSTPILNPPQCAILGMHKIVKRPIVVDDEIVIRPMMYVALSYDHRIVDGKEAVTFLVHLKNCLEDPARMILEI